MTKDIYYRIMESFNPEMDFKEIHDKWYDCFRFILNEFCNEYTENIVKSLFYNFEMSNWKAMWKENSVEFKEFSNKQLLEEFCGECGYIYDRVSYDRLFRTHWLFIHAFEKELDKIKYPTLYK